MTKQEFHLIVLSWGEDISKVRKYFFWGSKEKEAYVKALEIYPHIKTMWHEERSSFSCKGHYKSVRRAYLRYVAQLFDMNCCLWANMPANLCKEILHKLDQGWISKYCFSKEFLNYLCWKASLVGYNKRPIKRPCYVNRKLKIVFDFSEAVGIANYSCGIVEILFFNPLLSQKMTNAEALEKIKKWKHLVYPQYFAGLPKYRICKLANIFNQSENNDELLIKDCHLADLKATPSLHAPLSTVALDAYGELSFTGKQSRAQNTYAAIRMNFEQFFSLNPRAGFPGHYIFYEK